METAKIRKAGYAIRHTYSQFVERYRHLGRNIRPAHKIDCIIAARQICQRVLANVPEQYQFGKTKIFLKESHDAVLESERSIFYLRYIVLIQRAFRRVLFFKYIRKHRNAAITIQKHWRARGFRANYLVMRNGYRRLQAAVKSRALTYRFGRIRDVILRLQAHCRGYLIRKNLKEKRTYRSQRINELRVLKRKEEIQFKQSGNKRWREDADANYWLRIDELNRELALEAESKKPAVVKPQQPINAEEDNKIVDDVFGFLDGPNSPRPAVKRQASFAVSKMLQYFEEKSRNQKLIPPKLLSRPVNYYESSRL